MKLSAVFSTAVLARSLSLTSSFSLYPNTVSSTIKMPQSQQTLVFVPQSVSSSRGMFTGGALEIVEEDDDEKRGQIEQMAKAMGISVEEYQLGIRARERMEAAISNLRVVGGDLDSLGVSVERDGNMPPRHLMVTVTEEGKRGGKERLEKLLVEALKSASDKSLVGRNEAQKDMMAYISENYKKLGLK